MPGREKRERRKEAKSLGIQAVRRYILNSVTRSGHIPAVRQSTKGIFHDDDENGENGPRADSARLSIKRRAEFDLHICY